MMNALGGVLITFLQNSKNSLVYTYNCSSLFLGFRYRHFSKAVTLHFNCLVEQLIQFMKQNPAVKLLALQREHLHSHSNLSCEVASHKKNEC